MSLKSRSLEISPSASGQTLMRAEVLRRFGYVKFSEAIVLLSFLQLNLGHISIGGLDYVLHGSDPRVIPGTLSHGLIPFRGVLWRLLSWYDWSVTRTEIVLGPFVLNVTKTVVFFFLHIYDMGRNDSELWREGERARRGMSDQLHD